MTEIIQSYSLKFHDETIPNLLKDLINNDNYNNDYHFGVLSFTMNNNDNCFIHCKKHIHFVFNIDHSGSMDDECKDGRTKMRHIIYTLENMIKVFYEKIKNNQEINISIYIQIFDSEVTPIITNITNIRDYNQKDLIDIIRKITPCGSTNISNALTSAANHITEYINLYPQNEIVHILLTDGEITCGDFDPNILKSKLIINNLSSNIFIGYGKTHDSNLLSYLGNVTKGQYRIVDILENAGLVYGEIIHGIFYKILDNVKIFCENGLTIYNYLTNEWTTELEIDPLSCEQKKDYQIRFPKNNINNFDNLNNLTYSIILEGTLSNETNYIHTFKPEINNNNINNLNLYEDLTIYLLRQKTQELLYKSRELENKKYNYKFNIYDFNNFDDQHLFNDRNINFENKDKLKQELKELHKIIIKYIKDEKEKNDKQDKKENFNSNFLKNLADDIYICYKTIGTYYGGMFTYARQISQGKQQTYTCSSIDDNDNNFNHNNSINDNIDNLYIPMTPIKSIANRKINVTTSIMNNNKKGKVGFNATPFTFVLESDNNTNENTLDEDNDINSYKLLSDNISPYKTTGIIDMMTQLSKLDDDNYESE